jgi:hypothetical protein
LTISKKYAIIRVQKEKEIIKMKYRPIDDDPICADGSIDAYENCEECPYFYDCYEEVEETFEPGRPVNNIMALNP